MALQVWLPLNGNLNNQGLSNITITNNGATVYNNGKIGKCYYFNGANYLIGNGPLSTATTEFSIAFWVKYDNLSNYHCMYSQRTVTGQGITVWKNGNHIRFDDGAAQWETSYVFTVNAWTHVTLTRNASQKKLYINGELKDTGSSSTLQNISTKFLIGKSSPNNDTTAPNANPLYGYLNDMRVYDHCLSPKEIKELSKGLVLHYKLGDTINTNLFKATPKAYNPAAYNAYQLQMTENLQSGQTYTVQLWDVDVSHTNKTASQLGLSLYWGGGSVNLKTCNGTSYFTNGHADYITFTITPTASQASGSGAGNAWINVYNSVPSASGTLNMHIGAWKLEKGSIATALYGSSAKEYDCSGYGNDGTIGGTLTISTDSSRYSASTVFNGSSYVNAGRGAMVRDAISVCCWGYMASWSSYNARLMSCTETGGWNFEPSSGKMAFACGTGASSNVYKSATGTTALSALTSGWHQFIGTYDGFNTKIYIDGVLDGTNAAYTTKTPLFYNSSNAIFVGAEAGSSASAPVGSYFNGRLSDVRIYATALSADDIKELYDTSAYIYNNGTLASYEFIEKDGNISINKNGIVNGKNFTEDASETKFYESGEIKTINLIEI